MHERDVPFLDRLDQVVIESVAARIPPAEAGVAEFAARNFLQHRMMGLRQRIDDLRAVAIRERGLLRRFGLVETGDRLAIWRANIKAARAARNAALPYFKPA
jgi:hypothetical protein